jgi:hypothetical protein
MTGENAARLEGILSGPWREQAEFCRAGLAGLDSAAQRRYLRSHYTDPAGITSQAEMRLRESFDQALEGLQLLELAVACGYLPLETVRTAAAGEYTTLLAGPAARQYLVTYDFAPVRFLAARLGIDLALRPVTPPAVNPRAALRYAVLLAVHSEFTASGPVERFTMLLDDYRFAGLIDAPFFKRQLASADWPLAGAQQAVFAELCVGLLLFVTLLGDFFLQAEPAERPLFGCLYAYWLGHFFGVRRTGQGYQAGWHSFEDVTPGEPLFPAALGADAQRAEQQRFAARLGLLRLVWDETRAFLESLDASPRAAQPR